MECFEKFSDCVEQCAGYRPSVKDELYTHEDCRCNELNVPKKTKKERRFKEERIWNMKALELQPLLGFLRNSMK